MVNLESASGVTRGQQAADRARAAADEALAAIRALQNDTLVVDDMVFASQSNLSRMASEDMGRVNTDFTMGKLHRSESNSESNIRISGELDVHPQRQTVAALRNNLSRTASEEMGQKNTHFFSIGKLLRSHSESDVSVSGGLGGHPQRLTEDLLHQHIQQSAVDHRPQSGGRRHSGNLAALPVHCVADFATVGASQRAHGSSVASSRRNSVSESVGVY